MKVTALIAEDEPLLAANLQAELLKLWPDLQFVASVGDGETAVQSALSVQPDVIFLDIRMPGMTGLECAQALAEDWPANGRHFPLIVFVTAYDEYALQAFERAAFDYVLKPVQPDRLAKSCARLKTRLADRTSPPPDEASLGKVVEQMRELLAPGRADASPLPTVSAPLRVIQASAGNTITMVPIDEVCYFEAADKYVRVVTATREHLIRMSLRELIRQLDSQRFWQIHRGTIVRCDAIDAAERDEAGKLTLTLRDNPARLVVSRVYNDLFKGM